MIPDDAGTATRCRGRPHLIRRKALDGEARSVRVPAGTGKARAFSRGRGSMARRSDSDANGYAPKCPMSLEAFQHCCAPGLRRRLAD